jgi:predicted MFS family arabinose efflux permease
MNVNARPLQGNIGKLYAFSVLKMTLFPMAVITLFWKDQIGLSLTEILVLQAIFSVACILMEYPSGYLSDRIGYRSALILASLLAIAGWSLYTVANSFSGVLLAEIFLGAAWAFISGSDTALLFETLRARGWEDNYARFDGRMNGAAQTGEAAGALLAGAMYAYWPLMPFILQIGIWIICLMLCISLVEPPRESETAIHSHLSEALSTCRYAFVDNPHIRATILFGSLLGLASFYTVWLIQPYMQETGVPLAWFGPAWAGANLTVALFSLISHRLHFEFGHLRMVALFIVLIVAGYAGLGLTATAGSFLFYYLLTAMRGLQGPIMRNHLQRAGRRRNRASILSLHSLSFRLLFVATGPLVGMAADHLGLRPTFIVLAMTFTVLLLPAAWLFLRTLPGRAEGAAGEGV